jgi:hypothetical protein
MGSSSASVKNPMPHQFFNPHLKSMARNRRTLPLPLAPESRPWASRARAPSGERTSNSGKPTDFEASCTFPSLASANGSSSPLPGAAKPLSIFIRRAIPAPFTDWTWFSAAPTLGMPSIASTRCSWAMALAIMTQPCASASQSSLLSAAVSALPSSSIPAITPMSRSSPQEVITCSQNSSGMTAIPVRPKLSLLSISMPAIFHPVSANGSAFALARGGSTFGYLGTGTPQFFLGGPGQLSAYGLHELFGNQYFLGRIGYLYKIFTLPPFVGKQVYLYGAGEVGKMYNDPSAPKLSGDGAVGAVAVTMFGPVLIGYSVGDTGHHKWFFQLGRVF